MCDDQVNNKRETYIWTWNMSSTNVPMAKFVQFLHLRLCPMCFDGTLCSESAGTLRFAPVWSSFAITSNEGQNRYIDPTGNHRFAQPSLNDLGDRTARRSVDLASIVSHAAMISHTTPLSSLLVSKQQAAFLSFLSGSSGIAFAVRIISTKRISVKTDASNDCHIECDIALLS